MGSGKDCRRNKMCQCERRGRLVVEAEREKWKDMTACMMSDEEDVGENTFKTHQPEWRS